MFHRLLVPVYHGGLPAGYDLINDPTHPSVGGSGVAAFADGKKVGGPNDGTYFVGFGDDATSSNANRTHLALAQNTDLIDDILHRDLALTARTADVVAGAPVSQVVISGDVFVGESGATNNQDQRDRLISILDQDDNEITDANGVKVTASLIHNGASVNVVGTEADGFFDSPTVNLSVPVPAGVTYRVYYGERTNLASLPRDAFTDIKIRGAQEVAADVQEVLKRLHAVIIEQEWNDPWDATIRALAFGGLDARYRKSTTYSGFDPAQYDTAGSGNFIVRDGSAVEIRYPDIDLATTTYPDPQLAGIEGVPQQVPVFGVNWPDDNRGGDVLLYQESDYKSTPDDSEVTRTRISGPVVMEAVPKDIRASTTGAGGTYKTRLSPSVVGTSNPDGGADSVAKATVQAGGSDYFAMSGAGTLSERSAIRSTDLVQVTASPSGAVIGTYRPSLVSETRVLLRTLTGALADFGLAPSAVTFKWLQPTVYMGGALADSVDGMFGYPRRFSFMQPGYMSTQPGSEKSVPSVLFLAAERRRTDAVPGVTLDHRKSLGWGGFAGYDWTETGYLESDGGIRTFGGRQKLGFVSRNTQSITLNDGGHNVAIDPYGASHIRLSTAGGVGTGVYTILASTVGGFEAGDEFAIFLEIAAGTTGPISFNWGSDFVFSADDGIIPSENTTTLTIVVYLEFRRLTPSAGSSRWVCVNRRDYLTSF